MLNWVNETLGNLEKNYPERRIRQLLPGSCFVYVKELLEKCTQEGFYEFKDEDKLSILGKLDLNRYIPLEKYSRYGEFVIDEQFR